jgi:uncharacterized protein YndB with AHSA1/START domain
VKKYDMSGFSRTGAAFVLVAAMPLCAAAQDTGPVITQGAVAAPVSAVWNAWTTVEGLRAWLTPKAEIDLRVGGLIRTNYREQEVLGDPGTIVYRILDFEPQRMLALQITGPPDNFPFPKAVLNMYFVMYFEPLDGNASRVRIVSRGFGTDDESQRMRAFFEAGDAITLERLQLHFRAIRPDGGR